jgi:hypothetical protein
MTDLESFYFAEYLLSGQIFIKNEDDHESI